MKKLETTLLLSICLGLTLPTCFAQEVTFSDPIVITTEVWGAQSVYSADLDGDGDMDVLSASLLDSTIAWYENRDGLGEFGTQQTITRFAYGVNSVYSADFDGDGDMDVLSASRYDVNIAWYENRDGLGDFGPLQVITTEAIGTQSVHSSDLDGDCDMDVLSASFYYEDGKIAWYENTDGEGNFGAQQVITTDVYSDCSVYSADFDGDGDMDVLTESSWYENTDGFGNFGPQQEIVGDNRSVYSTDLDGDDDMDVLSTSGSRNEQEDSIIAWHENMDGEGDFGPQQVITTEAIWATSVYSADLDNDSDMDVLSASWWDDKIAWYENTDGLGSFGPQQVITTEAIWAQSVYSTDLDGDYDIDVLSASDSMIAWYRNSLINSVEDRPEMRPVSYQLMPVFPNPFNPSTTLTVSLPSASRLSVKVFNTLGQQVAVLANSNYDAGFHNFTFDGSDMASGIYLVKAEVKGKMKEVRKIVLMK